MLIRNFDYMEKAMSISYVDIRRQSFKLENQHAARRKILQDLGYKLTSEYRESLLLPADTWTDGNGVERPYVSIGVTNDSGNFQRTSLAGLRLDGEHRLSFQISTTIDDSQVTGGAHYLISISMWKDGGTLYVDVGKGKSKIAVSTPNEEMAFAEVCAAMKQLIMAGLTDARLD